MGAIWRARRAVVIGDPLQIEPVVTAPRRTTRLIFKANCADPSAWAAPEQSAQTLADRASQIQGRFRIENGEAGREERITGIPLLVHRRCERPMFDIANRIAYAEHMVFATASSISNQPIPPAPNPWNIRPTDAKVVETTGTTRKKIPQSAALGLGAPGPPWAALAMVFRDGLIVRTAATMKAPVQADRGREQLVAGLPERAAVPWAGTLQVLVGLRPKPGPGQRACHIRLTVLQQSRQPRRVVAESGTRLHRRSMFDRTPFLLGCRGGQACLR